MTPHQRIQPGVDMHAGSSVEMMPGLHRRGFRAKLVFSDVPYGINWQAAGHDLIDFDNNPWLASRAFVPPAVRLMTEDAVLVYFSRIDVAPIWERQMCLAGLTVQPRLPWDKLSPWHDKMNIQSEVVLVGFRGNPTTYIDDGAQVLRYHRPLTKESRANSPTPKPVNMLEYIIRKFTLPGDVVFDPCAGEAPIGVAAIATGRRYLGVEIVPERYEAAVARLQREVKYREALDPERLRLLKARCVA